MFFSFAARNQASGVLSSFTRFLILTLAIFAALLPPLSQRGLALSQTNVDHQSHRPKKRGPVTKYFQAMISHSPGAWPQIPVSTLRLWDTGTRWSQLNPAAGTYDWTTLDKWLAAGKQHNVGFLFTLGMTPQWASSNPNDQICNYGPGQCDAPNDLNPDGSGTDQHWKDFVEAAARHVGTQITYWEIWNEPNNLWYWDSTPAQLARMAQDARGVIQSINPKAKLLNPGVGAHRIYGMKWWQDYGAAGGLEWADIIALHGDVRGYPAHCGEYPIPEDFLMVTQNLHKILAQYGQNHKSLWDTESSWGRTDQDCFTDQDLHAAFLARFYLMHLSEGIRRFYWRGWIDGDGGLFDPNRGTLNKAGVAYRELKGWLTGNTLTNQCAKSGTVWTCNFEGPNGYMAEAVWDTSQTCKNGQCGTRTYSSDPRYVDYRTLAGEKIGIQNHKVPIGAKPILLEN